MSLSAAAARRRSSATRASSWARSSAERLASAALRCSSISIGLSFKTRTFLTHLLGEPRTVFGLCGRLWRGGRWLLLLLDLDLLGGFSSRFCGSCDSPSALKILGAIDGRGQRKRHQDCDEHDARHYPRTPTSNKFFLCGPMTLAAFHHIALQLAIKLSTPSGAAPCLSRRLDRGPCSHNSLIRHMRLLWRVGRGVPKLQRYLV